MKPKYKKLIWIAPAAIVGMVLFVFIGGQIVMRLWNWLLPSLFGWREITFWEALGLLALCRVLFGGSGMHGSTRSKVRRRVKERMEERWEHMTPEERERFRQGMRAHWGSRPSGGETQEL
jgi:hypothetical protein